MSEDLSSILLGTAGLSLAALAALFLTLTRDEVSSSPQARQAAVHTASGAVLIQAFHFGEEFLTGFHRHFPELLGLAPWSSLFFASFNVFWLAVWGLSCLGLLAGRRPALAALWFLGLAALANAFAHPALSLRVGGYFPGLFTSPILGILGVLLVRRLTALTRGGGAARGAA